MKFTVLCYLYPQPQQEGESLKQQFLKYLLSHVYIYSDHVTDSRAPPTKSFNPIEPIRCRFKCLALSVD